MNCRKSSFATNPACARNVSRGVSCGARCVYVRARPCACVHDGCSVWWLCPRGGWGHTQNTYHVHDIHHVVDRLPLLRERARVLNAHANAAQPIGSFYTWSNVLVVPLRGIPPAQGKANMLVYDKFDRRICIASHSSRAPLGGTGGSARVSGRMRTQRLDANRKGRE